MGLHKKKIINIKNWKVNKLINDGRILARRPVLMQGFLIDVIRV